MRWAASVAALALAGCAGTPGMPIEPPAPEPEVALVSVLHEFVSADAPTRAEMYVDAVGALAVDPSPRNRLRLALMQGWPGHPHSRPADALRLLERLLEDDTLEADDRDLALVLSFWISQRGTDQRLQRSLRSRVAALERELAATREQLAALAAIERLMDPDLCNAEGDDDCAQTRQDPAR